VVERVVTTIIHLNNLPLEALDTQDSVVHLIIIHLIQLDLRTCPVLLHLMNPKQEVQDHLHQQMERTGLDRNSVCSLEVSQTESRMVG